jgi:hypothetical protein
MVTVLPSILKDMLFMNHTHQHDCYNSCSRRNYVYEYSSHLMPANASAGMTVTLDNSLH